MGPQEHAFRSGVDVIVGTPGRLLDHFRAPYAKLAGLQYLVLDEADRMLDMGFLPDIRRVLRHIPAARQTFFFSATIPPPIAALSREMLRDPVTINLERRAAPASGITQAVYPVPQQLKPALLVALLKRGDMSDALVFTRTKHRADRLARAPGQQGVKAERIHGNRSQPQRTEALAGFKSGKYQVLVATDIAARGIDVDRARARRQLRRAARAGQLHPPRGPHGARRGNGRSLHVRLAGGRGRAFAESSGRSASGCRVSRCRTSTTPHGMKRDSRSRWPSGSRVIRARKAEERAHGQGQSRPPPAARGRPDGRDAARMRRPLGGGAPGGRSGPPRERPWGKAAGGTADNVAQES